MAQNTISPAQGAYGEYLNHSLFIMNRWIARTNMEGSDLQEYLEYFDNITDKEDFLEHVSRRDMPTRVQELRQDFDNHVPKLRFETEKADNESMYDIGAYDDPFLDTDIGGFQKLDQATQVLRGRYDKLVKARGIDKFREMREEKDEKTLLDYSKEIQLETYSADKLTDVLLDQDRAKLGNYTSELFDDDDDHEDDNDRKVLNLLRNQYLKMHKSCRIRSLYMRKVYDNLLIPTLDELQQMSFRLICLALIHDTLIEALAAKGLPIAYLNISPNQIPVKKGQGLKPLIRPPDVVANSFLRKEIGWHFYKGSYQNLLKDLCNPDKLEDESKHMASYLYSQYFREPNWEASSERTVHSSRFKTPFLWNSQSPPRSIPDYVGYRLDGYRIGYPNKLAHTVIECKVAVKTIEADSEYIFNAMEQVSLACDRGLNGITLAEGLTSCFVILLMGEYISFFFFDASITTDERRRRGRQMDQPYAWNGLIPLSLDYDRRYDIGLPVASVVNRYAVEYYIPAKLKELHGVGSRPTPKGFHESYTGDAYFFDLRSAVQQGIVEEHFKYMAKMSPAYYRDNHTNRPLDPDRLTTIAHQEVERAWNLLDGLSDT